MPRTRETQIGFLGVNLRRDPLTMADGDVVRAINADFHLQPGAFRRRLGRLRLNATRYGFPITLISRQEDIRYIVGNGTLYSDTTALVSGLGRTPTTVVAYRPLNDTQTWIFLANRNLAPLKKVNGSTVYDWGIAPPGAEPTLGTTAGALTGDYSAVYTYVRLAGTSVAHESNPSPIPSAVTLAAQGLTLAVEASTDPQVGAIRIYRTVADGSTHLFDQQVANATATITSIQADTALGAAVEEDNDVPPDSLSWVTSFQQHMFFCGVSGQQNQLWYSKRFRPESVPTDQYLLLGLPSDPLLCAVPLAGLLGVFSRDTKYRVFGNATSGFTAMEALSSRGTIAPRAILLLSSGVGFIARDGLWSTNFVEPDTYLSAELQPLFTGQARNDYLPIDLGETNAMALCEYRRRFYFAYKDIQGTSMVAVYSQDTQKWYHYDWSATSLYFDERADALLLGGTDGYLYTAEHGTTDHGAAISMVVQLGTGIQRDRFTRKLFQWIRADIATEGEQVEVDVYIDDALRTTLVITGERTRALRRLPPGLLGQSWHVVIRSTGVKPVTVYAIDIMSQPLEYA